MKVVAKIETREAINNIEQIIQSSDGIQINRVKLGILVGDKNLTATKEEIVRLCNKYGKPVIVAAGIDIKKKFTNNKSIIKELKKEITMGTDAFLLTKETAVAEDPIQMVIDMYELINESDLVAKTDYTMDDINMEENMITDYIVYNAYRTSKELPIKAIICPTETGYTPARLSALKPEVPIISFTKNDDAYRYLNLLW